MPDDCPLCELAPITKRYLDGEIVAVVDCATCAMPMLVLRKHAMLDGLELDVFGDMARRLCERLFGAEFRGFHKEQHRHPDHLHWHVLLRE